MIAIAAGAFDMGTDDGPADERPAHTVVLAAFSIDRLPVTNAQFAAFLDKAGLTNSSGERLFDADDQDARIRLRGGKWGADAGFADPLQILSLTMFETTPLHQLLTLTPPSLIAPNSPNQLNLFEN